MKSRGFTLIELLVVIAIIGLLATLSVVSFSTSRDKARISKGAGFSAQILRSTGDDIVGRWDFDDCSGTTAADMSGFGGNGTITAATWSTDTQNNQGCSLSFNGTSSYIDIADSSRFDLGSFTLSAWIKTPDAGTSRRRIVSQQDANYWVFSLLDNRLELLSSRDVGSASLIYGPLLNDNKWHHVAAVRDLGKRLNVYIDGSLVGSTAVTDTGTYQMVSNIIIGRHAAAAAQYFTGLIDEVRIYGRAISSKGIHQMYAEGLPKHLASTEKVE